MAEDVFVIYGSNKASMEAVHELRANGLKTIHIKNKAPGVVVAEIAKMGADASNSRVIAYGETSGTIEVARSVAATGLSQKPALVRDSTPSDYDPKIISLFPASTRIEEIIGGFHRSPNIVQDTTASPPTVSSNEPASNSFQQHPDASGQPSGRGYMEPPMMAQPSGPIQVQEPVVAPIESQPATTLEVDYSGDAQTASHVELEPIPEGIPIPKEDEVPVGVVDQWEPPLDAEEIYKVAESEIETKAASTEYPLVDENIPIPDGYNPPSFTSAPPAYDSLEEVTEVVAMSTDNPQEQNQPPWEQTEPVQEPDQPFPQGSPPYPQEQSPQPFHDPQYQPQQAPPQPQPPQQPVYQPPPEQQQPVYEGPSQAPSTPWTEPSSPPPPQPSPQEYPTSPPPQPPDNPYPVQEPQPPQQPVYEPPPQSYEQPQPQPQQPTHGPPPQQFTPEPQPPQQPVYQPPQPQQPVYEPPPEQQQPAYEPPPQAYEQPPQSQPAVESYQPEQIQQTPHPWEQQPQPREEEYPPAQETVQPQSPPAAPLQIPQQTQPIYETPPQYQQPPQALQQPPQPAPEQQEQQVDPFAYQPPQPAAPQSYQPSPPAPSPLKPPWQENPSEQARPKPEGVSYELPAPSGFGAAYGDTSFGSSKWNKQAQSFMSGKQGKIVSVVAAKGGCGKSSVSLWLAEALTASGQKVALCDANLGQADISKMLDIRNTPGLSGLIGGENFTEQDLESVLVKIPEVGTVLAGPPNPLEAELYNTLATLNLAANSLATWNDVVILDPPVASVYEPIYSRSVLHIADILIVVTNPHKTTLEDTAKWLNILWKPVVEGGSGWSKERCVGVLNMADPGSGLDIRTIQSWIPDLKFVAQVPKVEEVVAASNAKQWQCPTKAKTPMLEMVHDLFGVMPVGGVKLPAAGKKEKSRKASKDAPKAPIWKRILGAG